MRKAHNLNKYLLNSFMRKSESMQLMQNLQNPLHSPSTKHELSQQLSFSKQFKHSTHELISFNAKMTIAIVNAAIGEVEEAIEKAHAMTTTMIIVEADEVARDQNYRTILTNTA